ncbi:hypothetical protein [Salisediminibacterium beveridgei]|uniref:hypothetical protein n=1 Tax=Salisediminibacterium beveridgei TaxID=632773 RepID=UPI0018DB8555|nr:hypothetical protein [Salisediminibacterium beveridgei]
MAKNTGNGRKGSIKDRSQFETPNGNWTKRDTDTGKFIDKKDTPYKGVRKE